MSKKVILVARICSALSSILCLFGHNIWQFAITFAISAIGQNLNSGSEEALMNCSDFYYINAPSEASVHPPEAVKSPRLYS